MVSNSNRHISSARLLGAFALGCIFFAYGFVHRVAPSVMTGELMRDFSVGGSALGSLSAMYFYAYVSLQIPVGLLMDKFGPHKLMTGALILCAVASFSMSVSETLSTASVSRLVIGGSVAFAFVGSLTILTRWFVPERFSMYAGVLQSCGMIGAILGQAPLRIVVEQYHWRGAMSVLAAVALVLAIAAFVIIPRRSKLNSSDCTTNTHGSFAAIIKQPGNWFCVLAGFGLTAPMLGFSALWAVPWLTSVHGFDHTHSAGIASMVFIGWLIFAPVAGWISDRSGRRRSVLIVGGSISLIALIVILTIETNSVWLMGVLFFIQGAGGCTMIICFSVIREYNPHGNTSAALGMLNTFVVGSGAVMQPLIGFVLDSQWAGKLQDGARIYEASNYNRAFLPLIIANALAIGFCMLLKRTDRAIHY